MCVRTVCTCVRWCVCVLGQCVHVLGLCVHVLGLYVYVLGWCVCVRMVCTCVRTVYMCVRMVCMCVAYLFSTEFSPLKMENQIIDHKQHSFPEPIQNSYPGNKSVTHSDAKQPTSQSYQTNYPSLH